MYPTESLRLVIGSDILAETDDWRISTGYCDSATNHPNQAGFPGGGLGNFPE